MLRGVRYKWLKNMRGTFSVPSGTFLARLLWGRSHSVGYAECRRRKKLREECLWVPRDVRCMLRGLVGGTTDGARRSTVDTLNMCSWAVTG